MTHDEHVARHQLMHQIFDELLADFLRWNPGKLPSTTTVIELMVWSYLQTVNPSEEKP